MSDRLFVTWRQCYSLMSPDSVSILLHDRSELVWRMPKERFDELSVAEHGRYGKSSVMVWKGTNVNGKTDLYAIEKGTLTAFRFYNAILDQCVRSFAGSIGQEFILMDDNARPHHAHITNAYLEHETIVHMDTGPEYD